MARYLSLESAKKHLNVEHEEDDEYIAELIDSAECAVENYINQPLEAVEIAGGGLPAPLLHAIRIMVGKLYADREGNRMGKMSEVPHTLVSLFLPYRRER